MQIIVLPLYTQVSYLEDTIQSLRVKIKEISKELASFQGGDAHAHAHSERGASGEGEK